MMKHGVKVLPAMTLTEIKQWQEVYANDCEQLQPKAEELARLVLRTINAEVPIEQGVVKYARQHTLETVISLLQAKV